MTLAEIIPPITLIVPPIAAAAEGYPAGGAWGLAAGLLIGAVLGVPSFFGARRLPLDGPAAMLLFPWLLLVSVATGLSIAVLFPRPVPNHALQPTAGAMEHSR